jgi:hypothetical protein
VGECRKSEARKRYECDRGVIFLTIVTFGLVVFGRTAELTEPQSLCRFGQLADKILLSRDFDWFSGKPEMRCINLQLRYLAGLWGIDNHRAHTTYRSLPEDLVVYSNREMSIGPLRDLL